MSGSYDINDNEWGSVVFEKFAWPMNKEWGIDFGKGGILKRMIGVRVGLTNDLHCREISLFMTSLGILSGWSTESKLFPEKK